MITKRQKQILDFIKDYDNKKGYAPSLKEIKKHFKLSSESTVHQHLGILEEKGYLARKKINLVA
jgi:repressor LexA